jgi:hypothetical protein
MDDGSALYAAFRQGATNKVNGEIDRHIAYNRQYRENFNPGGSGGMYIGELTHKDVSNVMQYFSNVEYGNVESNLLTAMDKVRARYQKADTKNALYEGAYSSKGNLANFALPPSFWSEMAEYAVAIRDHKMNNAENYLLLNWNVWLSNTSLVSNANKYMASSNFPVVDVQV